ncbi:hypothetical protein FHG66_21220 [Rubellimicrobium rubrum]|uniref:Peptidase M10 serralysin C-terminal domain-containing protein n=1 Tax=Rubellimicrobium rubrum TaxID=2585369 RepID=A0A5C4MI41_9RHOB|nr:hypothetical protein FHG66_21220 [Rubellimicrobium rubrum]
MAVKIGSLAPRSTVLDNGRLELSGALGTQTVRVGTNTFVYVAGQDDAGISGFRVNANGSLTNVANRADSDDVALSGVANFATATIDGSTYLYANSTYENGITAFRVNPTGTLTRVDVYFDSGPLELSGTTGRMSIAVVNGNPRLVVSGASDDGFSVFQIGFDGRLSRLANRTDAANPQFELNGAMDTATAVVGGRSLIFVAGRDDAGISSFELRPDERVVFRDSYSDSDGPAASLSGVTGLATATVAGATYVIAAGQYDNGVTSLAVNASGGLTFADNLTESTFSGLAGASSVTSFRLEGESFVAVSARNDDALSLVHVGRGGQLTEVTRVFDTAGTALGDGQYNSFAVVGGRPMLLATGADDNGVTAFEIGGRNDRLAGGRAADVLLGLGGNDVLIGNGGNDRLIGGFGADELVGGAGRDTLSGGAGADDFVFTSLAHSGTSAATADVIRGFGRGVDDIDLTTIDARSGSLRNDAFVLDTNGSFSAGEVRQRVVQGNLLIELNADADPQAEMAILLAGAQARLAASDFLL